VIRVSVPARLLGKGEPDEPEDEAHSKNYTGSSRANQLETAGYHCWQMDRRENNSDSKDRRR